MPEHECVEIVVTADDRGWLAQWARDLVEQRLAACVHRVDPIRAVYRWEAAIHDDEQARIMIHTRASLVPAIVDKANREHPDQVPCVIALPITGGHPAYLKWVYDETIDPQARA